MATAPPLPPRNPSETSLSGASTASMSSPRPRADTVHLTPYSKHHPGRITTGPYSGGFDDPRSSSTQSLRPVDSVDGTRRTLLLIYIHGFLGDETSFKSFPAHVHYLLTTTLAESHVIHSKIYPRYKSRKKINFARDDFSHWLEPHESPNTDVVLIGHSLGGILAAEVVLMPPSPGSPAPFRHNILGQVAFDTPFLGMHPGVISTGIASLFRSPPQSTEVSPSETETMSLASELSSNPEESSEAKLIVSVSEGETETMSLASELSSNPEDPNFNPTYANDMPLAHRSGTLNRAFYFWNKHWGELSKATSSYVTSHLEFGGCLADYPGLKRRYEAVRALEDVDAFQPDARTKRVRFVNYYSASTGRIKERERSASPHSGTASPLSASVQNLSLEEPLTNLDPHPMANTPSPRLSVEEYRDGQVIHKELEEAAVDAKEATGDDNVGGEEQPDPSASNTEPVALEPIRTSSTVELSPLPPLPDPPPAFDESQYTDPDNLKLARKEHERQVKAHERIKKDREKTLRAREKLVQKRDKAAQKEAEKQKKEQLKRSSTINPEAYDKQLQEDVKAGAPPKKQKDRKFCTLPSKDPRTRMRDPTWVRVYMEGMDEVVAHTSMFLVSETYAKLVGDTAARIEEWVKEDATRRAVQEAAYE